MTVTGGSALGKDEINRMVKEAESHAAEDKARREAVEVRNEGDALAFRTEKLLEENADKIPSDVAEPVKEAIATLKKALEGTDNTDEIKAAMDDLNKKAQAMGQAMYAAAQSQAQSSASSSEGPADSDPSAGTSGDDGDVVDAEIIDEDK